MDGDMSTTPKSKRKKHDFLTTKAMTALRKEITELAMNDFGYDRERYGKQIARFRETHSHDPNVEKVVERMRFKQESFYDEFIQFETIEILEIWRNIASEFERANSIYPTGEALLEEFKERRLRFDRCIGYLFDLQVEIEYIGQTLPVDKNRYDNLADRIMELIKMVKGVRQSSNRFLKDLPAPADD